MRRKLPFLLMATFLVFGATACEGPVGPRGPAGAPGDPGEPGEPGAPGEPGMDALNTCSDCHSADATIVAIEQQFEMSPHGFGEFEVRGPDYAGGSCVGCHTSQGFEARFEEGDADFTGGVASMNCRTCHDIHEDTDGDGNIEADEGYALTTTDPVTLLVSGETVDFSFDGAANAGSNLCAACHMARPEDAWPDYSAPVTQLFEIPSTHYDLHSSPQANTYMSLYPETIEYGVATTGSFGSHDALSCNGCHMGFGVEGLTPTPTPDGELGHTFTVGEEVCATCHGGGLDYGSVQSDVMAMMEDLGACLAAEGVIEFDTEGGFHPVVDNEDTPEVNEGEHPEPYVAAYLVYSGVYADGSWGVHQPRFVPSLVEAALTQMETQSALCPVVVAAN